MVLFASCQQEINGLIEEKISEQEKDTIKTIAIEVESIKDLRTLKGIEDQTVNLLGYYSKGDKKPLLYRFKIGNFIDNGGSVIIPENVASGAWVAEIEKTVSITDYGAIGDGKTDNTEAINKCIANHDNVWIPEGIFRTNTIHIKSNLTVDGEGELKLIDLKHLISIINVENVKINNITLNGNHEVDLNGELIDSHGVNILKRSTSIYINNVKFSNFAKDGIYINEYICQEGFLPENIHITNCHISGIQRNGISVISGKNIQIENCDISSFKLCGIDIEPNINNTLIDSIYVRNCTIDKKYLTPGAGLQCSIGSANNNFSIFKNIYFIGNTVSRSIRNKGFVNAQASKNIITESISIALQGFSVMNENTIYFDGIGSFTTSTCGAIIAYSDSTMIEKNVIYGTAFNGIVLYETSNCIVRDNIIKDFGLLESATNKSAGIYILREGNNNLITSNHISSTVAETSYGISGSRSSGNLIKDNTFNVSVKYYLNLDNQEYIQ